MSNTLYAVILAGGTGTRLWPRSRKHRPKQLLDLFSERTLLQETYDRIVPLVTPSRVLVVTNQEYMADVRIQLPFLHADQIIGEPDGRGTAPSAGLAAAVLAARDPDATTIVLPADHVISGGDAFRDALARAAQIAHDNYLVTLGIRPSHPETGYGYIEAGDSLAGAGDAPAYTVRRFVEKPTSDTAAQFLAAGNYYWNSGIFIWRASTVLDALASYMPELRQQLDAIVSRGLEDPSFQEQWRAIANQTLDYGVMEKASRVAMVPLDAGWNDVGSWAALFDLMPHDGDDNAIHAEHIGVDTHGSLLYAGHKRLIATIGVEDLIIIDTDDALLICRRDRAQDVRQIVEELKRRRGDDYL